MKKLVALGGILIAVSSFPLNAQTIVPNPKPGTVLWKQSVDELDLYTAPVLDADGVLWGTRPWPPYQPKGFNTRTVAPIANTLPPFSFPELRLRSKAAFLADGSAIIDTEENQGAILSALGSHPWIANNRSRKAPGVVTASDRYFYAYSMLLEGSGGIYQETLGAVEGANGENVLDEPLAAPGSGGFDGFVGFAPGGDLLAVRIHGTEFRLQGFNTRSGIKTLDLLLPERIRPYDINNDVRYRLRNYAVSTEQGLIVLTAFRYPPPGQVGYEESGIWIVNPNRPEEQRFVKLGKQERNVTGIAALRNGLLYVSIADTVEGQRLGGIRGIDPSTGQIVVIPNVADFIDSPPVVAPDGTLYVFGQEGYPGATGATIYAIATGSKGGLARSPWPRSTGDNLNSFREQGVEDSDGDGLTDDEEISIYRTDPRLADTDGDGYSDGVEVLNASDPLNKSHIPEILEAQVAIKLSFGTNVGKRYRLQSSIDLLTWTNEGEPFDGTGTRSTQLVEASRARFYWRLVRVD